MWFKMSYNRQKLNTINFEAILLLKVDSFVITDILMLTYKIALKIRNEYFVFG